MKEVTEGDKRDGESNGMGRRWAKLAGEMGNIG